ncbi:MAG: flagellar basal body L-ring protein FlgH [Gammaproteobacteria bacterium]|nr:flagellar basal body L-ring protein FlgH [Gammaproteobacteria bacterium]
MSLRITLVAILVLLLSACAGRQTREVVAWEPVPPMAVAEPTRTAGAIVSLGNEMNLFADVKARRVGDIITIELVEKTAARKSSSTQTSKDTAIDNDNATLFGVPLTQNGIPVLRQEVGGKHSFAGEGASSQSNELEGSVTVTVAQRLPNGNLIVRGEKWLTLNQGQEFVRVSGIVRPFDIGPNNSVPSYKVADARIIYSGKGAVADANRQGWLSRFFNNPIMPF